jgi:hypothetical protein
MLYSNTDLPNVLTRRVLRRLSKDILSYLYENNVTKIVLAGGGLLKTYNDLDLYGLSNDVENVSNFTKLVDQLLDKKVALLNAATKRFGKKKVQFCKYFKPTIQDLVKSFDFSHCQVAVEITIAPNPVQAVINKVYCTPQFLDSMITGSTDYTGSEYPLGSLIRIPKVAKKLKLSIKETTNLTIAVLASVLERGIKDYDDFKEQLKAVDLNHFPDNKDDLQIIYKKLTSIL